MFSISKRLNSKSYMRALHRSEFNFIKNTRWLIVGGTGLIGTAIVDKLSVVDSCTIYVLVRNIEAATLIFKSKSNIHIVDINLFLQGQFCEGVDYIINAASPAGPEEIYSDFFGVVNCNIVINTKLLEYSCSTKAKYVFISSAEVYGDSGNRVQDEKYVGKINQLNERSIYPLSKSLGENIVINFHCHYSVSYNIFRLAHIFGPFPKESDSRVIAQFLRNAINQNNIELRSEGIQVRSWTYVHEAVDSIFYILDKKIQNKVFNIANTDTTCTIREISEKIAKIFGVNVCRTFDHEADTYKFSNTKKSLLSNRELLSTGFLFKLSLEQALIEIKQICNECQ